MAFGDPTDASYVRYEIITTYHDGGNPINVRVIVDPFGANEFGLSEQAFADLDQLALDVAEFISQRASIMNTTSVGRSIQRTSGALFEVP